MKIKLICNKRYSFCSCGLSKNLPYCDNEHRGYNLKNETNYKSIKITSNKDVNIEVVSSNWNKDDKKI